MNIKYTSKNQKNAHPYIPNSNNSSQKKMLDYLELKNIKQLIDYVIPKKYQLKKELNIPSPISEEVKLKKYIFDILNKNISCEDYLCFLGGEECNYYVPAIVDEIINRSEFLTAYTGGPYEDHGRYQALFEYQSLMAELLDLEVVSLPIYSWGHAIGTSLRMSSRITKRNKVLIAENISKQRFEIISNYISPHLEKKTIKFDQNKGTINLEDLKNKMSNDVAGVYIENPNFFGVLEEDVQAISEIVHNHKSLFIVGVNPLSLGIIKPPSNYGADIVTGTLQPLGVHMSFGGGEAGFVATHNDPIFVSEIPYRINGLGFSSDKEYAFDDIAFERTSYMIRERPDKSKEIVGTQVNLYGIAAAVYLSLIGPKGIRKIGEFLIYNTEYLIKNLSTLKKIDGPRFKGLHFNQVVIDFNKSKMTLDYINNLLFKKYKIIGGKKLNDYEFLKNSMLVCITDKHSKSDIDYFINSLKDIIGDD